MTLPGSSGTFLATLAHELRNPLAPVRMAAELLEVVKDDTTRLEQVSNVITRQTANMTRLIDDLLDVSRITHGRIDLRKERLDLGSLIAQTVSPFRDECERAEITFTSELPRSPLVIDGDPVRIAQIIDNLLNNAHKFTEPGGSIHVSATEEDGQALIRVRDSGIGIERSHLEHIFEMFAQVGSPGRTTQGGLGIGLSLTRSLVELHGGAIEAKSDGRGKGSEFTVRLPLAPPGEPPHPPGVGRTAGDDREPVDTTDTASPLRSVLAVDDNRDALTAVATLLRYNGHDVETAESGAEALEKARIQQPDVIFLDVGMPEVDGYEVAHRIRRQPWGQTILLVAVTGWGQEKDKEEALNAGFDVHLTKPADPEEIHRILVDLERDR